MAITTFVLTGGPCAGKSTAEELLRAKLTEYGVRPLFVRETAMEMVRSGIELSDMQRTEEIWGKFQEQILRAQFDEYTNKVALAGLCSASHVVILFDKGLRDTWVTMGEGEYRAAIGVILAEEEEKGNVTYKGVSAANLDHVMYTSVLHLVSAARGVPQHYNLANAARSEDVVAAEKLDLRTIDAWTGHPGLEIINNTQRGEEGREEVSFEEKMLTVLKIVCRRLELPVPTGVERQLAIAQVDMCRIPDAAVRTAISQVYLRSRGGVERRIRATELNGEVVFSYSERFTNYDLSRIRHSRVISEREFDTLLLDRNPEIEPLQKERIAFLYEGQYCKLDLITSGRPRQILEVELTEEAPTLIVPDFLRVAEE